MHRETQAPDREVGLDFADVDDALADHDFPTTGRALIEAHGDRTVGHAGGSARLGDLLGPLADETYETSAEVHQAVLTMVREEAVGRQDYSDRDPPRRDEPQSQDRSF